MLLHDSAFQLSFPHLSPSQTKHLNVPQGTENLRTQSFCFSSLTFKNTHKYISFHLNTIKSLTSLKRNKKNYISRTTLRTTRWPSTLLVEKHCWEIYEVFTAVNIMIYGLWNMTSAGWTHKIDCLVPLKMLEPIYWLWHHIRQTVVLIFSCPYIQYFQRFY